MSLKLFPYLSAVHVFIRKVRSAFSKLMNLVSTASCYWLAIGNPAITIGKNCQFGKSIKLLVTDGGSISIGARTSFCDHVQIVVQGGRLTVAEDVFIGIGCIIVCKENISIGKDSLIAEYVVIRDQDHIINSRPVRKSGFRTSPIHIGQDVWIGCQVTILRGAFVGDRCVIGAHALVKSHIAEDMLAVGLPAHSIQLARDNP